MVLMGDVLNYEESLSNSKYSKSLDWYHRAFEFYPKSANAVGKLAQLTSDQNSLEKLYYYSLYIGNSDGIKDHCISMNAALRRFTFDRNLENTTGASDHWISFSMALYAYLSAFKMKVDTEQMKANVYFCISSVGLMQMQDTEQVGKLIIIFIVLINSLEDQFLSAAEISAKKLIREKRSIGIMYLLALVMRQQEFVVESDEPKSSEAVLKVLSPFSLWLVLNPKLLRTSNTFENSIDKLLKEVLQKWISSLVKLSNLLAPRANMTMDRVEYLDIDRHLLGLKHYGFTFKNIDVELPNSNVITVLSSRLVRLAYVISQNEELSLICCYPNTTSMVFKEHAHDLQEKMIKNMTILATERLKDQVKDLETKLATFEQLKTVIYIVYTDILINRLDLVRVCLKSEKARMVISIEVIRDLDRQKTGNTVINYNAREATRYLEKKFQFPTPFLVGQKQTEKCSLHTMVEHHGFKEILSCALYYKIKFASSGCYLVTDDKELNQVANEVGISIVTSKNWRKHWSAPGS